MGLFNSRKTAEACDTAAATLGRVGTQAAGETGARAADAIANTVIRPIRNRSASAHACTRPDCQHD